MKLKNLIICSLLILFLFLLNSYYGFFLLRPFKSDFAEYWTALKIASAGNNPYNPSLMLRVQQELGYKNIHPEIPLMMWNPPWIFLFLYPILKLPFFVSYNVFFAVNLILILLINYLLVKNVFTNLSLIKSLMLSVVFLPFYYTLAISQISLLLTFATVLLYLALIKKNNVLAAFALLLLSLKPHLFYLVFFILCWQLIKLKNFKFPAYLVLFFSLTISLCYFLFPEALFGWLDVVLQKADLSLAIPPVQWKVPTLVGIVRHFCPNFSAIPMVLIPGVVCIATLIFLFKKGEINWKEIYPGLLAVSLFTSAFAWIFDYSSLFICQMQLLSIAQDQKKFQILFPTLLGFNIFSIYFSSIYISLHQDFWWYPLIVLLFSFWFLKKNLVEKSMASS